VRRVRRRVVRRRGVRRRKVEGVFPTIKVERLLRPPRCRPSTPPFINVS